MSKTRTITAIAPGKAILFGEHAVNRGQPALAVAVGLYARCTITSHDAGWRFVGGGREQETSREEIGALHERVTAWRAAGDVAKIRALATDDYFAPQKYLLAGAFGTALPAGLSVTWESEIPSSSGLGSGGAAYAALVTAVAPFLPERPSDADRGAWARLGDVIAHGGVASGLDTQTALRGGVIRYEGDGTGVP